MLNYLWGAMIVIGIIYGALTGNIQQVSDAAITSAEDAVKLCITMIGIMALWVGIMEICKKSGLIDILTRKLSPFVSFLFPDIPKDHPAMPHISMNIIANILGLGWAATPAGLKAMEELGKLNGYQKVASKEMCNFLIINISSLQLIPVSIIAYRSQFESLNPTAIIVPCILATLVSTLAGIIFIKVVGRK